MQSVRNKTDLNRLKSILEAQDKNVLVRILSERACQQEELADYLFSLASTTTMSGVDSLNQLDYAFEEHVSFLHDQDEGNVDAAALKIEILRIVRERFDASEFALVVALVRRSISNLQYYMPAIEHWGVQFSDEIDG